MTGVLIRRGEDKRDTLRSMPSGKRGRDWSDTAASYAMPRIAGSHQKLGRGTERFFPIGFRGSMALPMP